MQLCAKVVIILITYKNLSYFLVFFSHTGCQTLRVERLRVGELHSGMDRLHLGNTKEKQVFLWYFVQFALSLHAESILNIRMMEATTMTFTPEQWARHEKFVEMVRAAKQRKEAWVKKMQAQWAAEDQMRKEAADSHYYDIDEE